MKISPIKNLPVNKACAEKVLTKAANINSWQQRAALGVSGMVLQPMIDLHNKDVDEQTRKVSANRSFAKALVGATTGIILRAGCMFGVEKALNNEKFADGLAKITAENSSQSAVAKAKNFIKNQGGAKKYASVLGTIVALGVMTYTNFSVDAPLTNKLTNFLNRKYEKEDTASKGGQ